MDAVYMLQRKIRTLEEKTVPEYKSLVFYGEDDLSTDAKKYRIKFIGAKGGSLMVEVKLALQSEATLKLNGAKMSVYKPVNEDFMTVFVAEALQGENIFEVEFTDAKPENITVKLSGYIEEVPDESMLTILRQDGKTYVCHYDDRLKKATVYLINDVLQAVYKEANLVSAAISKGANEGEITFFAVSNGKTLTAKTLDIASGTANTPIAIEEGVRMVSGSLHGSLPCCYFIKDNALKFCEINGENLAVSYTGIKNACKIASTPNLGGAVAVIGYDRAATLYVEPQ